MRKAAAAGAQIILLQVEGGAWRLAQVGKAHRASCDYMLLASYPTTHTHLPRKPPPDLQELFENVYFCQEQKAVSRVHLWEGAAAGAPAQGRAVVAAPNTRVPRPAGIRTCDKHMHRIPS